MSGINIHGRLRITRVHASLLDLRSHSRPLSEEALQHGIKHGLAEVCVCKSNLVTDLGLSAVSRLIGFGLATPDVMNGVQTYGVSDINDLLVDTMTFGNLSGPTAPAAGDFAVEDGTPLSSVTPTVSYPGNAIVRWSGTIPSDVFTGDQVTEETLFCANGALFARTTFPPQAIVAGFGVQFDHDFTIARA